MGCFDSVKAVCPKCKGEDLEWQTKIYGCEMQTFYTGDVPLEIAADINGSVETCHNCGSRFEIRHHLSKRVPMQLIEL